MTDKSLLKEYKSTISDLTKEKQELNDTIVQKDSKIKQILIQLEQANNDIQSILEKYISIPSEKKIILTTEKDATRLKDFTSSCFSLLS